MGDDGDVPGGLCQERHEAVGRPVPAMLKALPSRRHVGERILSPQLIQNRISGADVLETHALPFSHAQLLQVIHASARRPYPKPWQKAITKTTKEPRTKQAIPPTETAAQYKERSPPWPFDLNYQGGFSRCFLFAQRFESPHITKMAFCISISSGARFCPLKRLKPLPQQGFQGLHLFQQP